MFDIWHRKWLAADWGMHFKSRMTLYLLYRTVSPLLVFSFHRAINQARSNPTVFLIVHTLKTLAQQGRKKGSTRAQTLRKIADLLVKLRGVGREREGRRRRNLEGVRGRMKETETRGRLAPSQTVAHCLNQFYSQRQVCKWPGNNYARKGKEHATGKTFFTPSFRRRIIL